ncbi:ATP-binding protein [Mucilaginibacter sp. dw_454]|uniref:AAA family ATPase n=1 Tax=Mucilaginibacter sp. dw_454 TaxID=2720079 RepID=UPI001BD2CC35|nr:ATP-binding protein [Mucilaginibacter sp. dw_454]
MLLKFTLANYRSFKEAVSLSLQVPYAGQPAENILCAGADRLPVYAFKSMVLLGANAAGKSNLFNGFSLMRSLVMNSAADTAGSNLQSIEPFRLNTETENKHSLFECTMLIGNTCYRYGFKCNNKDIHSEWLYLTEKRREEMVFIRTKNEYELIKRFAPSDKHKMIMLSEMTRSNALYLSVLAQFNIDFALQLHQWFAGNIVYDGSSLEDDINYTAQLFAHPTYRPLMNEIIDKSSLGFKVVEKQLNEPAGKFKVNYTQYNARNRPVDNVLFELGRQESSGARKLIGLLGPLVEVLINGGTCWIDEFDARLHPYIITMILGLFNSTKYNKNGAQLIAVSYNQQILKKLEPHQIIFMNKDNYGASSLGALYHENSDFKPNGIYLNAESELIIL